MASYLKAYLPHHLVAGLGQGQGPWRQAPLVEEENGQLEQPGEEGHVGREEGQTSSAYKNNIDFFKMKNESDLSVTDATS